MQSPIGYFCSALIVQLSQLKHQIGDRHGFLARQRAYALAFDSDSDLLDREHANVIGPRFSNFEMSGKQAQETVQI
jgi:hypothetical protein